MSYLVVGSNSFSGSHFINFLLDQGHEVLGVSRSDEIRDVFLPYTAHPASSRFRFQKIDLNRDVDSLMDLISENRTSHIVNFAAQGMVAQSWDTPEHWYQTNVVSQVKFHDKLRKLKFLEKYVHVTTPEVYGSTNGWVREKFDFAPSTPYAVSRASCDLHLRSFFRAYGFPVVFTRSANVYGPGQQLYRIIPRAMLYARLGKRLKLDGGGYSERSFIHACDVADATYKIAMSGAPGETFHISTTRTITIRDLIQKICDLSGIKFTDLVEVSEDRLGKDQAYFLDSGKVRAELGWVDGISLESGLAETLSWIDSNLALLQTLPDQYVHKP